MNEYEQQILKEYREMHCRGQYEDLCEKFCHEGLYIEIKQGWRQMSPEEYERQAIQIEKYSMWIAGICSHEEIGATRIDVIKKLADWIIAEERLGC